MFDNNFNLTITGFRKRAGNFVLYFGAGFR